jgi:hypothetical protein
VQSDVERCRRRITCTIRLLLVIFKPNNHPKDLALSYLRHAVARSETDILPLLQDADLVDEVYSIINARNPRDGSQNQNDPIIKLSAHKSAATQPKRLTQNSLMNTIESAMNGVTDKDRSVRLKAG